MRRYTPARIKKLELVLQLIRQHAKLKRSSTDPAGWVSLKMGCSFANAVKLINDATEYQRSLRKDK